MIIFSSISIQDIPRLAKIHTALDSNDKRFYHPCNMTFKDASKFLMKLLIDTKINKHTMTVIATDSATDVIMGFLFLRQKEDKCELGILVNPYCKKSGIGKMLMFRAREYAREIGIDIIWLAVLKENYAAIKLYLSSGFEKTGSYVKPYKDEIREYHEMELKV